MASLIEPDFGCCQTAFAKDYHLEWEMYFENSADCALNPFPANTSNNILGYNYQCRRYLSPHQQAIAHYQLRTKLLHVLTPSSYAYAVTVNPLFNYTVSSTQDVWSSDRYMKGNIIVPASHTLLIICGVAMTEDAKIIIEKGGCVIMSGSDAKVTNISGRLWGGFDVMGVKNLSPGLSGTFPNHTSSNQGLLMMLSGATIENSINGIRNFGYFGSSIDYGRAGGIIICENANFINNVRDVELMAYSHKYPTRFTNCNFLTTGLINEGRSPHVHVSNWDTEGVKFQGCHFENQVPTIYPDDGEGIHCINAIFTVESSSSRHSKFLQMHRGVSSWNSNPSRSIIIEDALFDGNSEGVNLSAMNSAKIAYNTFTNVTSPTGGIGISLQSCKGYDVSNNEFTGADLSAKAGIYAISSGAGAHRIYRNNFSNFYMAISPQYNNSGLNNPDDGLKMNCNIFDPVNYSIGDIVMVGENKGASQQLKEMWSPSVAREQGVASSDAIDAVRNQYGAGCYIGNNKWWIQSGMNYKQIIHGANTQTITQPNKPYTGCSDAKVVVGVGQSFNYTVHCQEAGMRKVTDPECPCRSCCLLDDINATIAELTTHHGTLNALYVSLIDGDRTDALLAAIADEHYGATNVKNLLLQDSPFLSDTVLKAYFASTLFPVTDQAKIHEKNRPVNDGVWAVLVARGIDPVAFDIFETQQADQLFSTRDSLESHLSKAYFDLESIYEEKLNYYTHDTLDGAKDSVIALLSANMHLIAAGPVRLLHAYKNAQEYTRAFAYADSLSNISKYAEIMELETALLKLDTTAKGMFAILDDENLRNVILDFALDSSKAGSWQARAVRHLVYGTDMHFRYLIPDFGGGGERIRQLENENSELKLSDQKGLKIFPNPSDHIFEVSYRSELNEPVRYLVYDLIGKTVAEGTLKPLEKTSLNFSQYNSGIYFIHVFRGEHLLETGKLILNK